MQLELFPGYTITSAEVGVEINNAIAEVPLNNQFEVLLYADNNIDAARDLVFRVNSPEANVVFSHVDPEQQVNVYIDGNAVIKGDLCITGDLLLSGKLNFIGTENDENSITYLIGETRLKYDIEKNLIFIDGKQTKNYFEIGRMMAKSLRKNQEKLMFNDFKDFFNY